MSRAGDLVECAVENLESGQDVILSAHGDSTWAIIWTERIDHDKVITCESLQSAAIFSDIGDDLFTSRNIVEPWRLIGDPGASLSRHRVCLPEIRVQVEINLLFCVLNNLTL